MIQANAGMILDMRRVTEIANRLLDQMRVEARESGQPVRHVPRCLVVEDDENDALLSRRALQAVGAEITWANSGDKALAELKKSTNPLVPDYDIVFLDLTLIGSSIQGIDVLRYLKVHLPRVHIVIVSGYVDDSFTEMLRRIKEQAGGGYIGIVTKPLEELDVQEIVSKHRLDAYEI